MVPKLRGTVDLLQVHDSRLCYHPYLLESDVGCDVIRKIWLSDIFGPRQIPSFIQDILRCNKYLVVSGMAEYGLVAKLCRMQI